MYNFLVVADIDILSNEEPNSLPIDLKVLYENLIGDKPIVIEDLYYSVLKLLHPYNDITLLSDTLDYDTALFKTTTAITLDLVDRYSDCEVFIVSGYENYLVLMGIFDNIYILIEKGKSISGDWVGFNNSFVVSVNEKYELRKVKIGED